MTVDYKKHIKTALIVLVVIVLLYLIYRIWAFLTIKSQIKTAYYQYDGLNQIDTDLSVYDTDSETYNPNKDYSNSTDAFDWENSDWGNGQMPKKIN